MFIKAGCMDDSGQRYLTYKESGATRMDGAWGFPANQLGPCRAKDLSFAANWNADSLEQGGLDYVFPSTRIHLLMGATDYQNTTERVKAFYNREVAEGQPWVKLEVVKAMAHNIEESKNGLAALKAALMGAPPAA